MDILAPGGRRIGRPGSRSTIRELPGGRAAAEEMFEKLTQGGVDVTPPDHNGKLFKLPGGEIIGLRPTPRGGPPTIDVKIGGRSLKLKFK
jgi:hypothetical protein